MDIRAVAAIADPEIITIDVWPQQIGVMKTNTILQYDSNYQNVKWGNPALAQKQSKHDRINKDLSSSKTDGDSCGGSGGSYVDREFLKFLSRKLGNQNEFEPFEFDIEEICPLLKHYCNDNIKEDMKENDDINY
ncbi:hypothetical protein C1646_761510 [Rhizophagus diaphanus]|nr:hypothetical protein C1646_761510 [Rhizophagus diaphanus] [Rhizophagus sp. MUCL 43196]